MAETIGLDDIVATLMSMGFEFQDCQDAITNGKLTVQAAVEWIIGGKPGNVAAAQPTLKLNRTEPRSSNPFSVNNTPTHVSPPFDLPANDVQDVDMTDDTAIVSRTHMSEKQQQIKIDFEERERQDAKKKVLEEKRRKKLEKERILKEIQEDREKHKLMKAKVDPNQTVEPVQEKQPEASASSSTSTSNCPADNTAMTSIQIRLPSGQIFRQAFSVTATLNNVWDTISLNMQSALNAYSGFIQPFPRKEYTREEMSNSLQSLGLIPSGSLVLKKKDADQASRPSESLQQPSGRHAREEGVQDCVLGEREREDEEEEMNREESGHHWGRGFRVEGEEVPPEPVVGEMDEMMEGNNNFEMFDEHPIFGHGRGRARAFGGFGNRLVPEGVPDDDGRHLNRRAVEMAAEAASQRFAQPRPAAQNQSESESHTELLYSAPTLQNISMNTLARRITDPRSPIHSMNGLSDDMLQVFLEYLKKEKLLRPKILHLMPSYLLKLNLDFYQYTTNELLHAARILVNLQTVSLASCPLITDSGLNSLKGMKVLKSLNLQGCGQMTDVCISVISELKSLHSLSLEGTGVSDSGVTQLATNGSCRDLLHLDLSRTSITHAVIPVLANFSNLKSIRLKQSKIISLSGIERITSLELIDISETDVVTDSILCLTQLPKLSFVSLVGTRHIIGDIALSYMQGMHLTSLILPCRDSTTDSGLTYITGFQLTSLDLTNYTQVGDPGMVHVGQLLSLKTLLLTNTRITDEGVLHLKDLRNLQVLFVDKTTVSNMGAAIVQNFRQLSELSLAGSCITSDFLKKEALNNCISLSKLNLSRTAVGDKGVQCLKLPNLTLLNLDCTRVHFYVVDVVKKKCPNIKTVTVANLTGVPEDEV